MQSKVQISCALRRMLCCQYSQRSPGYKSKSGYVLAWSRRSDSRARKKNSRRKKTFPPPRFPGVQLTRSPLTTALYYLDAWNRLDTCRIRVDGQIRFECGYVWTWTVLNPERKSCGFQNIRICVDGAFKFAITVSRAILIRWKSNTGLFFNQTPIVQICTKEINCEIAFQPYLYSLQWHILGMLSNAVFTSKNSFTYCITKVTFVRKINPRASNIVFSFLFKSEFNDSKTHWDLSSTWNWSKQLWE